MYSRSHDQEGSRVMIVKAKASKQAKQQNKLKKSSMRSKGKEEATTFAPVAISTTVRSRNPKIKQTAQSMRIAHRELVITGITGQNNFAVNYTMNINPGLPAVFPWLSTMAIKWEQYKVHRLNVQYVPVVGTSQAGEILLSPDYDASDPTPTTEQQAANMRDAVQDVCWKNVEMRLDPNAMMALGPRRFVRAGNEAGDIKTFDVAVVNICTVNITGSPNIGKIYLDYDIEFFIPQNSPTIVQTPSQATVIQSGVHTLASGIPAFADGLLIYYNCLQASVTGPGNNAILLPPGSYKISWKATFSDSANEKWFAQANLLKSSLNLPYNPPQSIMYSAAYGVAGGSFVTLNGCDLVTSSTGTEQIGLNCSATGAVGTLAVQVEYIIEVV